MAINFTGIPLSQDLIDVGVVELNAEQNAILNKLYSFEFFTPGRAISNDDVELNADVITAIARLVSKRNKEPQFLLGDQQPGMNSALERHLRAAGFSVVYSVKKDGKHASWIII